MKYTDVIGLDVSKSTIDAVLYSSKQHLQFENSVKGFKDFDRWVKKVLKCDEVMVCLEYTGQYSYQVSVFLSSKEYNFSIVPGLEIKKSMGIARGKNDKVDAFKIAEYGFLRRDTLPQYEQPSKAMVKLQRIVSLRDHLVKVNTGYKSTFVELKSIYKLKDRKEVTATLKKLIETNKVQVKKLEGIMIEIINSSNKMKTQFQLVNSVVGIGPIVSCYFLITTQCFTKFENSRKYACYCGAAPFTHQSGTSINRKSRVNHFANKKMKTLLHLSACVAIQYDPEIRSYYERRIALGKSKLSTINIVKNKLIGRVFAVIKSNKPYVVLGKHAA